MERNLLFVGLACLFLSFVIHAYFLQFLVIGSLCLGFYLANRRSKEMDELKHIIKEHNELMKQDIDLMKKDNLLN